MSNTVRQILALVLIGLLAGCNRSEPEIDRERQARIEAARREAAAVQVAQKEQARREFWQSTAYTAVVIAVVLLVVGTAVGARSRDAGHKP